MKTFLVSRTERDVRGNNVNNTLSLLLLADVRGDAYISPSVLSSAHIDV